MNDHDISLDDLLADAAAELRSVDMLSLAKAVDLARTRLDAVPMELVQRALADG